MGLSFGRDVRQRVGVPHQRLQTVIQDMGIDLRRRDVGVAEHLLQGHEVDWHWVMGHAGHPENERADERVRLGADETAGG